MAIDVFPQPVPYNKRPLPPVANISQAPTPDVKALHKGASTLTEYLTRELGFVERSIAATGRTSSRVVSSDVTATESDGFFAVDATSGAVDVTLPPALRYAGRIFYVKKIDATANVVTVLPSGTDTIDGAADVTLLTQNESVELYARPDGWFVLSQANILAPSGISGSGTIGTLPVFTAAQVIGDSIIAQSGGTATITGSLLATANGTFNGNLSVNGNTTLGNATSDSAISAGTLWAQYQSNFYPSTKSNPRSGANSWGVAIPNIANAIVAYGTTSSERALLFLHAEAGAEGPLIFLGKTRGTDPGRLSAVQSADNLGTISFRGATSTTEAVEGFRLNARVNGAVSAASLPTDAYVATHNGTTLADRWLWQAAGHYAAATDNVYDIGNSGALRPRHLFLGSNATIGGDLTQNSNTASVAQGTTGEGRLFIGSGTGSFGAIIVARATAGFGAGYRFSTGTNDSTGLRWQVYKSGDAESGSNVGSDYLIRAYSDTGTQIGGDVLNIQREATGAISWDTTRAFSVGALTTLALTATGAVSLSPANANVTISPTGTGTVTLAPTTAGTADNIVIGGVTPLAGTFTALNANTSLTTPLATITNLRGPSSILKYGVDASGSDAAATSFTEIAPLSTGIGTPAALVWQVGILGTTGSTPQVATEAFRVQEIAVSGARMVVGTNPTGALMGGMPLNASSSLLTSDNGFVAGTRASVVRAGNAGTMVVGRANGTFSSPTAVTVAGTPVAVGAFAGSAYNSDGLLQQVSDVVFYVRETPSTASRGGLVRIRANLVGASTMTSIVDFQHGGTNIAEMVAQRDTYRIVPGATALTIRDSANTLDAVTFNAAGTLTTIATALNVPTIGTLTAINTPTTLTISGTGETLATFVDDGAVTLYHNNVARIATTATGITVTDDITTGAPAGAAAAWRLGSLTTAAVTPDLTRYLEVSVGGAVYKVIIST